LKETFKHIFDKTLGTFIQGKPKSGAALFFTHDPRPTTMSNQRKFINKETYPFISFVPYIHLSTPTPSLPTKKSLILTRLEVGNLSEKIRHYVIPPTKVSFFSYKIEINVRTLTDNPLAADENLSIPFYY
jgi:hypothetical protein